MPLRIVFMGTPDFSVPTLRALAGAGHEIAAVYTQPPRAAGRRGLELTPSPVQREAERLGVYRGSADDARDGFIHFSTAAQVGETARKHFFGQLALLLVEVDADALGDALRWERSRNDELFPHLYGELGLGAVRCVFGMHARADGYHDIPELKP